MMHIVWQCVVGLIVAVALLEASLSFEEAHDDR